MSIYKQNIDPIALTEGAADEFLESVGVELFDDEISINGTLYEGAYGESILEANGIFLYEDGIVLEGKQAEEYMKKKDEDYDAMMDNLHGNVNRIGAGHRNYGNTDEDRERAELAKKIRSREENRRNSDMIKSYNRDKLIRNTSLAFPNNRRLKNESDKAKDDFRNNSRNYANLTYMNKNRVEDSINRHIRRHPNQYTKPKNESTIFSDIEII